MELHEHARHRHLTLEDIIAYHGHLGGFAILGFKAGLLLLELLQTPGYFELAVVAWCPPQTPESCLLDGLQLAAGCTMGKRNLDLRPSVEIQLRAVNLASGARVFLRPRDEALRHLRKLTREEGPEAAGQWAWAQEPSALWVAQDTAPGSVEA